MECIICSEEITATTGRTVLGCGHEFHMVCVARWFCRQEGVSSCPCCRRESGAYDDLPRAAAAEADEDSEADDDEADDEDDYASVYTIEEYWTRDAVGVWHQHFREPPDRGQWNPAVDAGDAVPPALGHGAAELQRIWRGFVARREYAAVTALMGLKKAGPGQASLPPELAHLR